MIKIKIKNKLEVNQFFLLKGEIEKKNHNLRLNDEIKNK